MWTSPHGYQYLRDHHGTLDVSRDRHPHPPDPCTHPGPHPRTTDSTAPHPAGPPPAGTSARPGQCRTGSRQAYSPAGLAHLVSTSSTNEQNRSRRSQREQDASIRVDVPAPGAGGSTRTRPSARRQAPLGLHRRRMTGRTALGLDQLDQRNPPRVTWSRHARPAPRAEADADRRAPRTQTPPLGSSQETHKLRGHLEATTSPRRLPMHTLPLSPDSQPATRTSPVPGRGTARDA